jgi:CubicO group peptidase (beta-lactamase class C family)
MTQLTDIAQSIAATYEVPGIAIGVWVDGREEYACHGITSIDNPLPVTLDTLFHLGSVSKTFTATAVMRLVEAGKIQLDDPVRRYVPELALADEQAAAEMTVLNLLNHTSGLGVRLVVETGDGDDALAGYVTRMAELDVFAQPGTRASYSQAGFNLLGRIVEKVTGQTFEQAVAALVLGPIGLKNTTYELNDVMLRRFAVGHNRDADGVLTVVRQWKDTRGNNPGGGIASSVSELLRWARFHLGDRAGDEVLPAAVRHRMMEPTVELRGSTLGDAFGICWFLREVDGVTTIGHGGSGNGQFAELLLVPERNFAVVVASNAGPEGTVGNQAVVRWALEHYLGLGERAPEPLPHDEARAQELAGSYEIDAMTLAISTDGARLTYDVDIKPAIRAASDKELPPGYTGELGLLPRDEYVVTSGGMQGQRGYVTRGDAGQIVGVDVAGRLFTAVAATPATSAGVGSDAEARCQAQ